MHDFYSTLASQWPLVAGLVAGTGAMIMWMKKQLLDNVFATKKEVRELSQHIDRRFTDGERNAMERHMQFQKEIASNHSELKTLLIHTLSEK